jgi:hypothetical protein
LNAPGCLVPGLPTVTQGSSVLWAAAASQRFMSGDYDFVLGVVGFAQTGAGVGQLTD